MHTTRALVALALVAVAAAACSGDDAAGDDPDRTVTVTMTDNAFRPDEIRVRSGETVRFRFVNDGEAVHEAYLGDADAQREHAREMTEADDDGHGMHMDGDQVTVEPGDSGEITTTFDRAGTVVIGCHQPGHWEGGMRATVDVGDA